MRNTRRKKLWQRNLEEYGHSLKKRSRHRRCCLFWYLVKRFCSAIRQIEICQHWWTKESLFLTDRVLPERKSRFIPFLIVLLICGLQRMQGNYLISMPSWSCGQKPDISKSMWIKSVTSVNLIPSWETRYWISSYLYLMLAWKYTKALISFIWRYLFYHAVFLCLKKSGR